MIPANSHLHHHQLCGELGGLVQHTGMRSSEVMFMLTVEGILYKSKQFNKNAIQLGKLESVRPCRVQIMFQIKELGLCSL